MENNITSCIKDNILIIEFTPGHRNNPFSGNRMELLQESINRADLDENIKVVILYGGNGNSFSVGGDFNEVSKFTGGEEVEVWLDRVTSLYKSLLKLSKPIIAAIDKYAIGFGLQLALTCDYRIGSKSSELKMPEFAMGIACNFGGYMLDRLIGRSVMQSMLFNCEGINAISAKNLGLLHEIIDDEDLLNHALKVAAKFASYPAIPIKETKATINRDIIAGLDEVCSRAKNAHKKSFAAGDAQGKMQKIIKKDL